MRWGHAVSRDLLAWTHLPVAINHWDDAYYDCPPWPAIFSGSVTLDDSGKFGTEKNLAGRETRLDLICRDDETEAAIRTEHVLTTAELSR